MVGMVRVVEMVLDHLGKYCQSITGPSYQNESSDSVSRKLLDEFENAFNTK